MMTARFVSGASLFALLIVDICCVPLKKGSNVGTSYGSSKANAPPYVGSSHFSPGVAQPYKDPKVVSAPSYQPVPELEPSFSQPAVQFQPAASVGSSFSSAPSGYSGSSVMLNPASSTQPGSAYQPASEDIHWAVPPPSLLSVDEEMSTVASSSQPEYVSPPLPPPGPMYQPGELSHYEGSFENGDYQTETEMQDYLPSPPAPPVKDSPGHVFTSQPIPMFRGWGVYPYYDYMFLTGQYPPGTVTHASSSYEQGRDSWQDALYLREHVPYNPPPVQQAVTFSDFAVPQSLDAPKV